MVDAIMHVDAHHTQTLIGLSQAGSRCGMGLNDTVVVAGSTIQFYTDGSVQNGGFKVCTGKSAYRKHKHLGTHAEERSSKTHVRATQVTLQAWYD